jgi:hypothetical protein
VRVALFVIAVVACMTAAQIMAAQPTGVPPVPAGLSAQQTSSLSASRERVVAEGKKLQITIEDHHAKCAHVGLLPLPSGQTPDPSEVALEQRCDAEQADIDRQVKRYAADTNAYRSAVDAAIAAGAHATNAYAARVVLKGGVNLTRSGAQQSLISSRVVQLASGDRITTVAHARAAFQLPDGNQFIVGPQSDVTLATMVNDPTPAKRRISFVLTKGALRWVSGTVTAAAGEQVSMEIGPGRVRVGVCDVQAGITAGGGYVALLKGDAKVVVPNKPTVVLRPNEIATYAQGGEFSAKPLQPNEIQSL